jgi:hypothetical protein
MSHDYSAPAIPVHKAWRLLDEWKMKGQELGIWVAGPAASASGVAAIAAVRNGAVELKGENWGMRLNLRDAEFSYGPMPTWPRWPAPPVVDVIALQAMIGGREWVVLAEGWRPTSLPPGAAV